MLLRRNQLPSCIGGPNRDRVLQINAFRYYKTDMTMRQNKTIADFAKMPKEHQEFVPRFHERMQAVCPCLETDLSA
jgi:hypothetical protein